jgi:hypothetical protein
MGALGVSGTHPNLPKSLKTCPSLEVQSIEVLTESDLPQARSKSAFLAPSPVPTIDILPTVREKNPASDNQQEYVMVTAHGPVLGSMDSQKVETKLLCTAKGVLLTATITRSAEYSGSVLKNAAWRPQINTKLAIYHSEVSFQVTWRMRLSTGAELSHAETPPYMDQKYPITLARTIQAIYRPTR